MGRVYIPSTSIVTRGLVAHWDPALGITQSGGTVSAWVDQINGYSVGQATGALQPAYTASLYNGRPGLTFDGSTNYLQATSGLSMTNNVAGFSITAVLCPTTYATTGTLGIRPIQISGGTANTQSRCGAMLINGGSAVSPVTHCITGRRLDADTAQTLNTVDSWMTGWGIFTWVWDYANAKASMYRNGLQVISPQTFQTAGNTSATDALIMTFGASNNPGPVIQSYFGGYMGDVVMNNVALQDIEVYNMHKYLNSDPSQKWSIY